MQIHICIENSRKCSFYRYLIYGFNIQYYLRKSIPIKYQRSIAKIRLSSNNLSIETGRCCFSCADCVKDEYHFILVCPVYANFRRKYI